MKDILVCGRRQESGAGGEQARALLCCSGTCCRFLKAKAVFKACWPLTTARALAFPFPKALSSLSRDNVTDLQTQATGFKAVYSLALVGLPWLAPVSHRVPCRDQEHILKMWLASQAVVMEEWRNDPNGSNPLTFSLALTNCPNK